MVKDRLSREGTITGLGGKGKEKPTHDFPALGSPLLKALKSHFAGYKCCCSQFIHLLSTSDGSQVLSTSTRSNGNAHSEQNDQEEKKTRVSLRAGDATVPAASLSFSHSGFAPFYEVPFYEVLLHFMKFLHNGYYAKLSIQ